MSKRPSGLGRGIDALFAENGRQGEQATLPVGEITPGPGQPREIFDDEALARLAESIGRQGVLQPILVRPEVDGSYSIVAGERRYRAARMAGLMEVPVVIREMTDEEAAAAALAENLSREDLNPVEEARGIRAFMDSYGKTQEETAAILGRSRPAVANSLRLLSLPEDVLGMISAGELSEGNARALLPLSDPEKISDTASEVVKKQLTVRQTEALVKEMTAERVTKRPRERDTLYDEVELSIRQTSGRRAKVKNAKKGGTLTVEYYDDEDLKRLARLLGE